MARNQLAPNGTVSELSCEPTTQNDPYFQLPQEPLVSNQLDIKISFWERHLYIHDLSSEHRSWF